MESSIVYKWGFICKNLAFLAVNYMLPIQISTVGTPKICTYIILKT